ncbi:MAG: hypothetical protein ACO3SP_03685 [Ilumatobacteraceae bacterium]
MVVDADEGGADGEEFDDSPEPVTRPMINTSPATAPTADMSIVRC